MDRVRAQPRSSQSFKTIALAAGAVAIVLVGGMTLANIDFTSKRVDRSRVSIETVHRGTMEIKVSANGQLLPRNVEYIAAQVDGRVAKTYVKPGAVVTAGQILVELTNPQLVDSAAEAYSAWEGSVTQAKASEAELQTSLLNQQVVRTEAQFNLERAEVKLEAETRLLGQHVFPEIDYKRDQLTVTQLKETVKLEEGRLQKMRDNIKVEQAVKQSRVTELARALDRARNNVANLKVVSGIDGIVQVLGVDVGQQLTPGSPIGRVAQIDKLYAELKVPARDASDVRVGQTVVVDTHNGTVNATVTRVDPAVTDGVVTVDADLTGALSQGARPQLPVEATVYISRIPDTLYVGKPAYVRSDSAMSVYRLDTEGRYAARVTIQSGKLSVNYLQVLGGLHEGDRIITSDYGPWQDKDLILIN
jgi:multidrug efflux pump subunit AcrA (membrane-fusion protein)